MVGVRVFLPFHYHRTTLVQLLILYFPFFDFFQKFWAFCTDSAYCKTNQVTCITHCVFTQLDERQTSFVVSGELHDESWWILREGRDIQRGVSLRN